MKNRAPAGEETATRADLVRLIGREVPLARLGRVLEGPCPFQETERDTFIVDPESGLWHCPDCGRQGDAVDWLVQWQRLSRSEAFRLLATADEGRDAA